MLLLQEVMCFPLLGYVRAGALDRRTGSGPRKANVERGRSTFVVASPERRTGVFCVRACPPPPNVERGVGAGSIERRHVSRVS